MRKIYLSIIASFLLSVTVVKSQNIFAENFDDIPTLLSTGGWTEHNNSVPLGAEIWHNGSGMGVGIPAFNGAAESFAEVGWTSTDSNGTGNISNWLITPAITVDNGQVVSFYATSFNNLAFPDRLELRMNILNTTNVGTTDTSVGDFNISLVAINPNLLQDSTLFPQDYWGQFSAVISGLSGTTSCRFAFRYNVTDGGGLGANSSTIGVDAFSVDFPLTTNNLNSDVNLNIYPNPVSDRLNIDFANALAENGIVNIYNATGQNVKSFSVFKGQTKAIFNTTSLSKGVYSMVVESKSTLVKKNFIVN